MANSGSWGSQAPVAEDRREQSSDSENDNDRETSANPNATGPTMRAPYSATAGQFGTDQHDDYPAPYPRVQRGALGFRRS